MIEEDVVGTDEGAVSEVVAEDTRSALESAWDQHSGESETDSPATEATNESIKPTSNTEKAGDKAPRPSKTSEGTQGKLNEQKDNKAAATSAGEESAATSTTAAGTKPPASWGPAVREHWGSIPPDAQAQILTREKQFATGIQRYAEAAKRADSYEKTLAPYAHMIAMEGADNVQAIGNLARTAATLRGGTPQQKADLLAELVSVYAIDLDTLDKAIVSRMNGAPAPAGGGSGPAPGNDIRAAIRQELAPIVQRQQQAQKMKVGNALKAFAADPKNEFFKDVAKTMADVIDVATKQKRQITLESAYETACNMTPEVARIIQERKAAEQTAQQASELERRRRASSSVIGNPSGAAPSSGVETRRGAIDAAWEAHSKGASRV